MAKKSVNKRIKITRTGKILRRSMALGHSRVNKRQTQIKRKGRMRSLALHPYTIQKYY